MTESEKPFSKAIIRPDEVQNWLPGMYLKSHKVEAGHATQPGKLLMPGIDEDTFVDQNGVNTFSEFESEAVVALTGFTAGQMRSSGCGISALHMVLSVLGGDEYLQQVPTVGKLALYALSLHRNDLREGNIKRKGTPVFNLEAGWYHDALLFIANQLIGAEVHRHENLTAWEDLMPDFEQLSNEGRKALCIVSVANQYWRQPNEPASLSTHLVIVSGMEVKDGHVVKIRVTDPFVHNGQKKINRWLDVGENEQKAFKGRAMFFIK